MATATKKSTELSDKERQEIIEKAQSELPDLDKRFKKAVDNLERISEGLRPR
jgi:uncharacterized membrane protein YukC